jgi:phage terminase small subunit
MSQTGEFLSVTEALFVDAYVTNGGKRREAALAAGLAESNADRAASRFLTYAAVRRYMRERMARAAEQKGLTPEFLAEKLHRGIKMSSKHLEVKVKNDDGEVTNTFFNHDAANSMHKLLTEAHKILDVYPEEKKEASTVNVNMQPVKEELDKARGKF